MKHHATPIPPHPEPDSDLRDDPTMQQLQALWDGLVITQSDTHPLNHSARSQSIQTVTDILPPHEQL